MRICNIPEGTFYGVDGIPFSEIKKDKDGEVVCKMDKDGNYLGEKVAGPDEKMVILVMPERTEVGFLRILTLAVLGIQKEIVAENAANKETVGISWEDTECGTGVIRAINVAKDGGQLELEDHAYKWLWDKFDKYGPRLYSYNAFLIREVLENPETTTQTRAEKRREEPKPKNKKR